MRNPELTYHTLCQLLSGRAGILLPSTFAPNDWRLLVDTAWREGVAPLLYHTLREAGWLANAPPDVQADLRQAYYAITARNLLIYRELSRILAALAAGPPTADRNTQLTSHIPPHAIPNPKSEIGNRESPSSP